MNKQLLEQALNIVKKERNMSDEDLFNAITNRMLNDNSVPEELKRNIKNITKE